MSVSSAAPQQKQYEESQQKPDPPGSLPSNYVRFRNELTELEIEIETHYRTTFEILLHLSKATKQMSELTAKTKQRLGVEERKLWLEHIMDNINNTKDWKDCLQGARTLFANMRRATESMEKLMRITQLITNAMDEQKQPESLQTHTGAPSPEALEVMIRQRDPRFLFISDKYLVPGAPNSGMTNSEIYSHYNLKTLYVQRVVLDPGFEHIHLYRSSLVKVAPQQDTELLRAALPRKLKGKKVQICGSYYLPYERVGVLLTQTVSSDKQVSFCVYQLNRVSIHGSPSVSALDEESSVVVCTRDAKDVFQNGLIRLSENREFIALKTSSKSVRIWRNDRDFATKKKPLGSSGIEVTLQEWIKDFSLYVSFPREYRETIGLAVLDRNDKVSLFGFTSTGAEITKVSESINLDPRLDSSTGFVSNLSYLCVGGKILLAILRVVQSSAKIQDLNHGSLPKTDKIEYSTSVVVSLHPVVSEGDRCLAAIEQANSELLKETPPAGEFTCKDLSKYRKTGLGYTMLCHELKPNQAKVFVYIGAPNYYMVVVDVELQTLSQDAEAVKDQSIHNSSGGDISKMMNPLVTEVWKTNRTVYPMGCLVESSSMNDLIRVSPQSSRIYPLFYEDFSPQGNPSTRPLKGVGVVDSAKGSNFALFYKNK